MEYHQSCLKKLCRICGNGTTSQRVVHNSGQYSERLKNTLDINIDRDDEHIHPTTMFNNCYRAMTHIEESNEYRSGIKAILWVAHRSSDCSTCSMYKRKSAGGETKEAERQEHEC